MAESYTDGASEAPSFVLNIPQEVNCLQSAGIEIDQEHEDSFENELLDEFGEAEMKQYFEDVDSSNKENIPESENSAASNSEIQNSDKGKTVSFLDLDEDLVKEVNAAGKKLDKIEWARTRFDAWRIKQGLSTEKIIEELDLRDFSRMLERFMLQVCKLRGGLYPTKTIQDMFRKFGAIIRRAQEVRIGLTGIEEVVFDIKKSPIFSNARKACIAAMRRSRMTPGVCGKRKKVDEISYSTEQALLADVDHSVYGSRGLQRRFMYYCVSRFAIWGRDELYKLVVSDFQVLPINGVECLEYSERTNKNYVVSMEKYQEESFRVPVQCFEEDVVFTFKCLVRHLPKPEDETADMFVFMQAINSPKSPVWYNKKHRVSGRVISSWMKYMLQTIGIEGTFTGKSGRSSVVSRLARANVPVDVGMTITGHRTSEAYKRYDKTIDLKSKAAMSIVSNPFNSDGSRKMFEDVYKEELQAYDMKQKSGNFAVIEPPSNLDYGSLSGGFSVPMSDVNKVADVNQVVVDVVKAGTAGNSAENSELVFKNSELNGPIIPTGGNELDGPFFDNISLEEIAGDNPRLRKAFNLNVEVGSTKILGGNFHNCIIVPGGGGVDISELVKMIRNSNS